MKAFRVGDLICINANRYFVFNKSFSLSQHARVREVQKDSCGFIIKDSDVYGFISCYMFGYGELSYVNKSYFRIIARVKR